MTSALALLAFGLMIWAFWKLLTGGSTSDKNGDGGWGGLG